MHRIGIFKRLSYCLLHDSSLLCSIWKVIITFIIIYFFCYLSSIFSFTLNIYVYGSFYKGFQHEGVGAYVFFLLMAVELFCELFVKMSFCFHCLNKDKLPMFMEIIVVSLICFIDLLIFNILTLIYLIRFYNILNVINKGTFILPVSLSLFSSKVLYRDNSIDSVERNGKSESLKTLGFWFKENGWSALKVGFYCMLPVFQFCWEIIYMYMYMYIFICVCMYIYIPF